MTNRLETTVITDYLTKLCSRKYLDDQIHVHMQTGHQGVFILFDIDDFKQVNDEYGHQVGDEVIKQVAHVIRHNLNPDDIPARWGGEELAVYVPDISIEQGKQLAASIKDQTAAETSPVITLSGGVSSWRQGAADTVKALFNPADHALYRAKRSGKNCVVEG